MRRANGFVLGTVLVVLIGGVVVLQALNQSGVSGEHDHDAAPPVQEQAAEAAEPSLDELESSIAAQKRLGPQQAPATIPDSEKFRPIDNDPTLPNARWWDKKKTDQAETD